MGSELTLRLENGLWLWLALLVLVLPLSWVLAWALAMGIHEMGHLLALRLCHVRVHSLVLGPFGAKIESEPMTAFQELICAAAGPLAGALLILAGRWVPLAALFALVQTGFNLLPFGDLDGGRIFCSLVGICEKALANRPKKGYNRSDQNIEV